MADLADTPSGGIIHKVITFGGPRSKNVDQFGIPINEFPSKQLLDDPFQSMAGYGTLVRIPPYSMEQLVLLAEQHPIHAACIEQKVADIVAAGPIFVPRDADAENEPSPEQKDQMQKWWESLSEDSTPLEILIAAWNDYETVGWGAIEIARDDTGLVRRIYHVPGHTLRAHQSGKFYIQIRQGKTVIFKQYGLEGDYYNSTIRAAPKGTDPSKLANELLIFRKPSRRSTWYGIPVYTSALGYLSLAVAARDYNVLFFENSREPRYVYVITGLAANVDGMAREIREELTSAHKEPFHNMIIPISGDANVQVEKLMQPQNDLHFSKMMDMCDEAILTAHRVPPDRLGIARRGFLGGSVANVTNRIYKDGVVARGQDILEDRLGRFFDIEFAKAINVKNAEKLLWRVDLEQIDISDESIDVANIVALVTNDLVTLNEARQKLGWSARDEFEDMTLSEWLQSNAPEPPPPPQIMQLPPGTTDAADEQQEDADAETGDGEKPRRRGKRPVAAAAYPPYAAQPRMFQLMTPYDRRTDQLMRKLDDLGGYIEELLSEHDDDDERAPLAGRNGRA